MQRIISDSYVGSVVISGCVESRTVEIFVIEKASRTPEFPRTYSDFSSRTGDVEGNLLIRRKFSGANL